MTLADMVAVIGGGPKAFGSIFWWCYAWHSGRDSDLYKIMRSLDFMPDPSIKFVDDPEVVANFAKLDEAFRPDPPPAYQPVALADVQESDVLVAGSKFTCLLNQWPCRVFKYAGALGVMCNGDAIFGKPKASFHQLTADENGIVVGFRR